MSNNNKKKTEKNIEKKREKVFNPEKYKKKKRKKKKEAIEKRKRAVSRENRNTIRNRISPYYTAFRQYKNKHLLFVLKDTENMEKVLLQKNDLGNGVILLALPTINYDMIDKYLNDNPSEKSKETTLTNLNNEAIKGIVDFYYSVNSDEITELPKSNMIVFRNCRVTDIHDDLVQLNVRPYDFTTWYKNEVTSIDGHKIYRGNQLKTFFNISGNLGKTYIFQDSVTELLIYKSLMNKIKFEDLVSDQKYLAKKGKTVGFYEIMVKDEDKLEELYKKETLESKILDGELFDDER